MLEAESARGWRYVAWFRVLEAGVNSVASYRLWFNQQKYQKSISFYEFEAAGGVSEDVYPRNDIDRNNG